ncbi:hypothetical protein U9M48_026249 [Paspalum notatum var. saurae]|uniref:Uncharacterized protein n=1 Tax=Paspalum notatum var. saurae TaxID=547442 RepID=A0AAQ3TWZ1_PASNO
MGNGDAVAEPAAKGKSRPECVYSADPSHEGSDSDYGTRKRLRIDDDLPDSRRKRSAEKRTVHPDRINASDPNHDDCSDDRGFMRTADANSGLERGEEQPTDIAAADAIGQPPDDDDADKQDDAGAAPGSGGKPLVAAIAGGNGAKPPVAAIARGSGGSGAFPWMARFPMDLSSSDDEDETLQVARDLLVTNQQYGLLACICMLAAVLEEAGVATGLEEEDEQFGYESSGTDEGEEDDGSDVTSGHDEGSRSTGGTSPLGHMVKIMNGILESLHTTNALALRVMQRESMSESIKEVMRLTVECGAAEGSVEHFMATILFVKAEYRVMFMTITTKEARLGWLKRWCQYMNMN